MSMRNFTMDTDILLQIRHLSKCLKHDFDKRLESLGLTGHQGRILFCVNHFYDDKKEVHQSDLEKFFSLSKSSVSEMVSRMEANGLVTREVSKPYIKLLPTEKGRSIVNEIEQGKQRTIEKLLKGFKNSEKKTLEKFVNKMIWNIEEEVVLCGKR